MEKQQPSASAFERHGEGNALALCLQTSMHERKGHTQTASLPHPPVPSVLLEGVEDGLLVILQHAHRLCCCVQVDVLAVVGPYVFQVEVRLPLPLRQNGCLECHRWSWHAS
jgi:hypothetical protein